MHKANTKRHTGTEWELYNNSIIIIDTKFESMVTSSGRKSVRNTGFEWRISPDGIHRYL